MKKYNLFLLLPLLLIPQIAFADVGVDSMFATFASSGTEIIKLLHKIAVVIGFIMGISAIYDLVKYAEDSRNGYKGAIVKTFIAVMLVSLSTSITSAGATLGLAETSQSGADTSIFSSEGDTPISQYSQGAMAGIIIFIKMFGHIAFIKGLLQLKSIGDQRSEGGLAKAFTHILGGAACIHLEPFVTALANTVGITL